MGLVLAACGTGSRGLATDTSSADRPMADEQGSASVTDMSKNAGAGGATFERGASLTPTGALLTWLDAKTRDGEPRLLRLPLVLSRAEVGFSTRGVRLGAASDALSLYANDAALGIGLADHASAIAKTAPTCALWVEGYWRGQREGEYTFDVVKIDGPWEAGPGASPTHVEVALEEETQE